MCEEDNLCSSKMSKEVKAHGSLRAAVLALYKRLDSAAKGKDKCADYFRSMSTYGELPSHVLRGKLASMVQGDPGRLLVFAILHRAYNCAAKDLAFLRSYFENSDEESATLAESAGKPVAVDTVFGMSNFLGSLIKASEMWVTPSPSWKSEMQSYEQGLFSLDMAGDFAYVCIFRANFQDPMCADLLKSVPDIAKVNATPFVYKPDKYWNKHAPIPSHASAMVINGALDYQTPKESGTAEYKGFQGTGDKILIDFDTGVHCSGLMPQTASDTSYCGYTIMASYVLNGGEVSRVNTTCMASLPAFDFGDLKAIRTVFRTLSTADELYDSKA